MKEEKTKVAFFIDRKRVRVEPGVYLPREVTAVFTDSGNFHIKECYSHIGQHSVCAVDWVEESCRAATYAENKPLYDELTKMVGYDLEVLEAAIWLDGAMDTFKAFRGETDNGKAA